MSIRGIVSRLLQVIITLIGVTFITFCLSYIAPGDPAMTVLETAEISVSQETLESTRHEMGLDRPFLVQYGSWLGQAVRGDLGQSYSAKKPVVDKMKEAAPATILLAFMSIAFMLVTAVPLGIITALKRNHWVDYLLRIVTFFAVSMPTFWTGLMLLYFFGLKLGWFTIGSSKASFEGAVLPALTLAFFMGGKYMRQMRLIVLEELEKEYVLGMRARGLSTTRIILHHVLPNTILPLITLLGMSIGWLLGGVAVVEIIFSWPGLGKMAINAIAMRDYPLIEGFVLWIALAYICLNFLVDLSYSWLDPRLSKEGHEK